MPFRYLRRLWSGHSPFWRILRVVLLTVIGFFGYIMLFEESFIFFPSKYPAGHWPEMPYQESEDKFRVTVEDCWFTTADGKKLHGWFAEVDRNSGDGDAGPPDLPVLLWFHGNAGNISNRFDKLLMMVRIPVNILIFDYRGYGRSEGRPNERGLYLDARAAWDYLVNERSFQPKQIILYGNSLGGVPAVDLALSVDPAGLIIQSSFTSVPDMAARTMPFIPRFIIRTRMDSETKVPKISCPKMFLHSQIDEVVPYDLGRKLFEAAAEPKVFYDIQNAGHNDAYMVEGAAYFERFRAFIQMCTRPD